MLTSKPTTPPINTVTISSKAPNPTKTHSGIHNATSKMPTEVPILSTEKTTIHIDPSTRMFTDVPELITTTKRHEKEKMTPKPTDGPLAVEKTIVAKFKISASTANVFTTTPTHTHTSMKVSEISPVTISSTPRDKKLYEADAVDKDSTSKQRCKWTECGPYSACHETEDNFVCTCKVGYQGAPPLIPCTVVPEPCLNTTCKEENSICLESETGPICQCRPGFFSISSTSVVDCRDINECASVETICPENQICKNDLGNYTCECAEGFEESNIKQGFCVDVDECESGEVECGQNSFCLNEIGSYQCKCKKGYEKQENECLDVDECSSDIKPCGTASDCINTVGSFECLCKKGFKEGFMGWCDDINECKEENVDCGANAHCVNTHGSYKCVCDEDYIHNEENVCIYVCDCGDFTECLEENGKKKCSCIEGFSGEPPKIPCKDIDECQLDVCGQNADCFNLSPGYNCACKEGFEGDAYSGCQDIDECQLNVCGKNADCNNQSPGYNCECKEGFEGDAYSGCSLAVGIKKAKESFDEKMCTSPLDCFKNSTCKEGICKCNSGFESIPPFCKDVDECSMDSGICGKNSHCINIVGGYLCSCSCSPGYDRYPPRYKSSKENACRRECEENASYLWSKKDNQHRCSCDHGLVESKTGGCILGLNLKKL